MIIYRAGKQIADVWVGAASYTLEEINGARIAYIEFTTLQPIGLTVNDYITYKGETYYVRHREDVTKEEVSRGFAYRVKLYHEMYRLHDVVVFPYEKPDFRKNMSKYNGTASQLLDIVVRSMNRVHAGWKAGNCVETKAETFDLKDKTCAEVVNEIATRFETEFYVQDRTLTIGRREIDRPGSRIYSQGPDGGFRSITLSAVEEVPPLTRLYAYGSDKNMAAQGTKDALEYLKLPGGALYLEKNVDKYGVIEQPKQFQDIYPHGVFTVTARVDEFTLQAAGIDFDLDAQLIDNTEPTVTFQDGGLAGYDLHIVKGSWDNKTKQFKLAKVEEEGALKVPGDIHFAVGDKFILTGIKMPKAYVDKASEELRVAAQKYLDGKCENRTKLAVVCDEVLFAKHSLSVQCGELMHVRDTRLGLDRKIRVTSVKRFIENDNEEPYRYEIVLSDFLEGNRFMQELSDIKKESKAARERAEEMVRYSRRTWQDVKETQEHLKKDFADKFKESINPVTIETMQLIVGHEQLQFVFVDSKTAPQKVVGVYPEFTGGRVRVQAAGLFLKHMTMGVKAITSRRDPSQYRYWEMADFTSDGLAADKVYRLYARVPVSGDSGTFVLYDTFKGMNDEAGFYLLLMGYIGAEREGNRSWGRTYGFTEILPGQITTELIQDPNAQLVIDLANGRITGPLTITAGSVGYNNLTDKPDLTGYLTKSEFKVTADQIRAEVGRANQTAGGTKAQLDAFQQQTQQNVNNLLSRQSTADDKIYRLQTAGFISRAEGNALYASAQLANGDTIASYITQSPSAINLISQNISLTGRAEFKSLQSQLNTQSDKLSNQQSQINNQQNQISYGDIDINRVKRNGTTIIEGGYIKTELINTKNLVVEKAASIGDFRVSKENGLQGNGTEILPNGLMRLSEWGSRLDLSGGGISSIPSSGSSFSLDNMQFTYGNAGVIFRLSVDRFGNEWVKRVKMSMSKLPHVNTVKLEGGAHTFRTLKWDENTGLVCWE
nr:MAG TPA: tail protein [Bacteriophage sp.]